jgi:SdpI/YfhL protein family
VKEGPGMFATEIASPATVLILLGAVTGLASLPLLLGRVGPNRFYGVRIRKAFSSDENWYRINAFGARCFLRFATAALGLGIVLKVYPRAPFWLPIACLVFTLFLLLLTVRAIDRYARSI